MTERFLAALDCDALADFGSLAEFGVHGFGEAAFDLFQRQAVLRTLRSGKRRLDRAKFELQDFGKDRVGCRFGVVHALGLGIRQHQRHGVRTPTGFAQIADGIVIDRKETASGAVFRRHVAERRPIGNGKTRQPRPEILDEFADHAALAQHLRDGQHQIGRGHAFLELAVKAHADHFRQHHRVRLAEHRGFGFDAADAPTEHRKAIHHRGVRIGADQRIRISNLAGDGLVGEFDLCLAGPNRLREIFKIDLVADAGAGRHHAEILKRALRPF